MFFVIAHMMYTEKGREQKHRCRKPLKTTSRLNYGWSCVQKAKLTSEPDGKLKTPGRYFHCTWMSRWKLGSKVRISGLNLYPQYTPFISRL